MGEAVSTDYPSLTHAFGEASHAAAQNFTPPRPAPQGRAGGVRLASAGGGGRRVLFVGEAIAISHVARPALLAAYLHERGYDVCLACDPRYNHLISCDGFRAAELQSLPGPLVLDRLRRNEPVYDADTLDRYVHQDLEVIREFEPDIVIGDQRHSLAVSSRLAGVPYVNIADAHWSPSADVEYELVEPPLAGIIGLPLANLIISVAHPVAFSFLTVPLNVVCAKYGLPGIGPDFRTFFTYGDYTFYPNDPGLFPLKQPLPPTHMFIGPLAWSPGVAKPAWWETLPEDRPIVYVSLGSTGQPDLLETVFQVLGELPVTVIAATAARKDVRSVPENVFVAEFLPGAEAAQRAWLVICNGGSMSGQQALSAGTPYLGLVSNIDQLLFTKIVRRTGACELIREGEVNEHTLRQSIRGMLSRESYRTAAKRLEASAAGWEPCDLFERAVRAILEERKGAHFSGAF